jgi:YhcH/YjgK/YiaL family protein
MIVCDLDELRQQVVLTPNMKTAVEFLETSGRSELAEGRVVVDGEKVYVEVQAYDSVERDAERFEGHRKYIDIQFVVSGEEIISWTSMKNVTETKAYDAEHDYWLGSAPADKITEVRLGAGQLAVLYPSDPHAPRKAIGSAAPVRKLVVKVAMD